MLLLLLEDEELEIVVVEMEVEVVSEVDDEVELVDGTVVTVVLVLTGVTVG